MAFESSDFFDTQLNNNLRAWAAANSLFRLFPIS